MCEHRLDFRDGQMISYVATIMSFQADPVDVEAW